MLWNTDQNCTPSEFLTHTVFEHNKMVVVLCHFHLVGLYTVIMGTSICFRVLLRGCSTLQWEPLWTLA